MENREAIEWLKGSVVSYEVDNKGRPNGNVTCDLTQEVIDLAISALEKQEKIIEFIESRKQLHSSPAWYEFGIVKELDEVKRYVEKM